MKLHDRMTYGDLRSNPRFARLNWRERDFYQGVWCVADDHGRFENEPEELRTVLYAPIQAKVSERDVREMLVRLHDVGLVKLYTVRGRGYGKVLDFRQTLKTRRALYPPEEDAPGQGELFPAETGDPPPREGRKEIPPTPRPAGGLDASQRPAALRPLRRRRAIPVARLFEDRDRVKADITAILRPGGCAYAVEPTAEKKEKLSRLREELAELDRQLAAAREENRNEEIA